MARRFTESPGGSLEARLKIDNVSAAAYRIPTEEPESDGTLTWTATTAVVVEVRAGDQTGLGYTYGSPACAALVSEELGFNSRAWRNCRSADAQS